MTARKYHDPEIVATLAEVQQVDEFRDRRECKQYYLGAAVHFGNDDGRGCEKIAHALEDAVGDGIGYFHAPAPALAPMGRIFEFTRAIEPFAQRLR
jgi:hypothetical protein